MQLGRSRGRDYRCRLTLALLSLIARDELLELWRRHFKSAMDHTRGLKKPLEAEAQPHRDDVGIVLAEERNFSTAVR